MREEVSYRDAIASKNVPIKAYIYISLSETPVINSSFNNTVSIIVYL